MALTSDQKKDIEQVVFSVVKQHFKKPPASAQFNGLSYDRTLLERIVRVEERIEGLTVLIKQTMNFMEKRFEAMEKRFEDINRRFEAMEKTTDKRFEAMEKAMNKRFEAVDKRFEAVDKRFEAVDKRFEDMNKRFEDMNKRFEDVNNRFKTTQWMIGIGFTLMGIFMAMLKLFA